MKIFVIILHFGKLSVTQECIESLYKIEKSQFFTIVVNNASDRISERDFKNKKRLTVINNPKNLGFSGGVNVGIRFAMSQKADVVILLNNDTSFNNALVFELSGILDKNKKIGVIAPTIHFKRNNNQIYDLGGKVNHWIGRTSHIEVAHIKDTSLRYAEYVSGCCMAIKAEVIKKVGQFDESFFLYYEDVDFCLRVKKAGYMIAVDPLVSIEHALSASTGKLSYLSTYHQIRSAIIFGKKYFSSFPKNICNKIFILVQTILFVKGNPQSGLGGIKALLNF